MAAIPACSSVLAESLKCSADPFKVKDVPVRFARPSDCLPVVVTVLALVSVLPGQTQPKVNHAEAIRPQQDRRALMNQQEMEKAIPKFDGALRAGE